jgi:hypothetical protein
MRSNDAMRTLCEVLAQEIGAGVEFELDLGELIGRYRREHEKHMREAEAARLLPRGAALVAQVQGCCRATAYNRAKRARLSNSTAAA